MFVLNVILFIMLFFFNVDVIGHVISYGNSKNKTCFGKKTKKIDVVLEDLEYVFFCDSHNFSFSTLSIGFNVTIFSNLLFAF